VADGFRESALLMVDPAEVVQDPGSALLVAEVLIALRCPLEVGDRIVEASAELLHVGGREQGIGFAVAVADLPMQRAGLVGQDHGLLEAVFIS